MLRRGQPLWWLVAAAAIAVALAPQAFVQHTDCASCVAAGFGWSLKKAKCGMFANHECGDSPPPPPPPPPPVDDDAAVISATFAVFRVVLLVWFCHCFDYFVLSIVPHSESNRFVLSSFSEQ